MLAGIPQQRASTSATRTRPSRLVEFADLQCPFCREYTLQTLPQLVQDYVRSGKVRMEFRDLAFLGKDSVTAGRHAAAAAGEQNKLWNFIDVFYFNQGEENSGYVTPSFLHTHRQGRRGRLGQGRRLRRFARVADAASSRPTRWATSCGVQSTPTVLVGKRGGALQQVQAGPTDVAPSSRPSTGCWGRREHRPAAAPRRDRPGRHRPRRRGLPDLHPLRGHQARLRAGRQLREGAELGVVQARRRPGRPARPRSATRRSSRRCSSTREEALVAGALFALAGFGFSAYLTYRELFSIDAICPWCVASAVIMTLLAIVTTARLLHGARHRTTRCGTLRRVKKTSLYLDPDLDEALARRAADEGLTKAEFIRRTLAARDAEAAAAQAAASASFAATDGLSVAERDCDQDDGRASARIDRRPRHQRRRRRSTTRPTPTTGCVADWIADARRGSRRPRRSPSPRWTTSSRQRGRPRRRRRCSGAISTPAPTRVRWWADALSETLAIARRHPFARPHRRLARRARRPAAHATASPPSTNTSDR